MNLRDNKSNINKRFKLSNPFNFVFGFFKKHNNTKSNRRYSKFYTPGNYNNQSKINSRSGTFKVFKPAPEKINTFNNKRSKIDLSSVKKFGFDPTNFIKRNTNILSAKNFLKNLRFQIVKWKVLERFNQIVFGVVTSCIVFFVVYLSFFDTYFLVKNYQINFSSGSYLDQSKIQQITKYFSEQKTLFIIPYNQYWFVNNQSLTDAAREEFPEIESIQITGRTWPNELNLEIETTPILATIEIVENGRLKYWRIDETGNIIAEDTLGLREKLVNVETPISFDQSGTTFKDYNLNDQEDQINRFWFINWMWEFLEEKNINIVKTSLPSIIDTDVKMTAENGTVLLFDSQSISRINHIRRFESTFNTKVGDSSIRQRFNQNTIEYIDFRISNRVFVCNKNTTCEDSII